MSLVLFGEPLWDSPFVFSVYVALLEKGVSFDEQVVDLDAGEHRSSKYRSPSLTGKVPALVHDHFWLTESLAIIEYLEELFPSPPVLPQDRASRARARQLMSWLRCSTGPLREERPATTLFYEPRTTPLSKRARENADEALSIAAAFVRSDQDNLFGDWSIADADLAFLLQRFIKNGDPISENLRAFANRQWARPSVQQFVNHARAPLPRVG